MDRSTGLRGRATRTFVGTARVPIRTHAARSCTGRSSNNTRAAANPVHDAGAVANKRERAMKARMERDAAYRQALGIKQGDALPTQIGAVSGAGAARGGRGRSNSTTARRQRRKNEAT